VEGANSDFGRSSRFTPLTCSYTVKAHWTIPFRPRTTGDGTYRGDESLVCAADLIVRLFEPVSKGMANAVSQRSFTNDVALQLFSANGHYSQQCTMQELV
jgi:hypothetical protein